MWQASAEIAFSNEHLFKPRLLDAFERFQLALMPIIKGIILEQSTIYTDCWRAYDGLVLNGYEHYRVFHSENEFARGKSHVNGIENFWSFAKRRLAKFNGCSSAAFVLCLK